MSVTKDYMWEANRELENLTYIKGSSCIIIDKRDFFSMIRGVYCSGYIKCINDMTQVKDKYNTFLNSSTQMGGYNMNMNMNTVLNRIDKLDNKYDKKIDILSNKLDDVNNNYNNLNREVGEIKTRVNDIYNRISFWKIYIMAPLITSIITAIIMKFIN